MFKLKSKRLGAELEVKELLQEDLVRYYDVMRQERAEITKEKGEGFLLSSPEQYALICKVALRAGIVKFTPHFEADAIPAQKGRVISFFGKALLRHLTEVLDFPKDIS